MRKLFAQLHVSVDGFFEGPNHELGWFLVDDEFFAYVNTMLASIDGIVLGRTTYEGFADYWPNSDQPEAATMNSLPKFVASTTLSETTWSNSTILSDIVNDITRLKEEPGKDLAVIGSAALTASLAAHGLIDEYRIFVVPVLLGGGSRFFEGLPERIELRLSDTHVYGSGVVLHCYLPPGASH